MPGAAEMDALGWHRAADRARRHVSTRLHALTLVPGALGHGRLAAVRSLAAHAFARVPHAPSGEAAASSSASPS